MRPRRSIAGLLLACVVVPVAAQQLYRWTDSTGRVVISDTAPPPSAKNVQKLNAPPPPADSVQDPYVLATAMKEFPVVLYTSPVCKEACTQARDALNKRGVPFKEVQVWDEKTNEELKRVSGTNAVPILLVGRSVQRGFEQGAYDSLLDSAGYPRTGILPARTQAAPALPEGYVPPSEREAPPKAEPAEPEETRPLGPYAPGAPRPQKK